MPHSDKKIICLRPDGGVSVITPADNCPLTFEEIVKKDVPYGWKYKIVDKDEVPSDRSFRNAWTVDEADVTDGVGTGEGGEAY